VSTAEPEAITTDAALMAGVHSGDQHSMAQLYDRHSSAVYGVALRVLGDSGTAEEVLQDVFMQLWRNPQVFDASRGSLGAWLAVIARNRAIDVLRKRPPESDLAAVAISVNVDLPTALDQNRAIEKIRGALRDMPAAQRSALEMAFFEGLTHTEIADRTGEPLGTVKTRIRTGLLALRKVFCT
jgi:RNA polymerase sigma-70 factor (ECF subfamily)